VGEAGELPLQTNSMNDLTIKDVAEQSGIASGTLRMWEQR
jgi:hypothetical protein